MQPIQAKRKFSAEEKQQLLANLDIEVEHRTRQLESWLADALENFRLHHEGHPNRIPRSILGVKMRDLEEKYNGDVQVCLRALQMDKLVSLGTGEERITKKRKWLAEHEGEDKDAAPAEGSRKVKTARVAITSTPKKKPVPAASSSTLASTSRARVVAKSPGNSRTIHRPPSRAPSPSPMKAAWGAAPPRPATRPASPTKVPSTPHGIPRRPPSSATFNPTLPKTPAYPSSSVIRLPRKNESMLSLNGSPIANPYEFGAGGLQDVQEEGEDAQAAVDSEKGRVKRSTSIVIRRDPSFLGSNPSKPGSSHSRENSQTGFNSHSRAHSQTSQHSQAHLQATPVQQRFPSLGQVQVTVPLKDGYSIEFNPLMVSPGALDDLEGITDSAKKQVREDMAHLVKEAVSKWSV